MMIGDIREVQRLNNWTEDQIGGFEVLLEDFDALQEKGSQIYQEIGVSLNSRTIAESYPGIFEWIQLFDNNVWFIITLMIIVAGVNMISAMLVLILEKVQFIGMLKAMGSPNASIRKIFLYNASYLIIRGLLWGNGIGLAILGIQYFFEVIQLNPETYYVNVMPVYITFIQWFLLNLGTLILCVLMLIIPSYIIATVEPKKAIKFA
jgi:lipoprotein-releasing system permease protein